MICKWDSRNKFLETMLLVFFKKQESFLNSIIQVSWHFCIPDHLVIWKSSLVAYCSIYLQTYQNTGFGIGHVLRFCQLRARRALMQSNDVPLRAIRHLLRQLLLWLYLRQQRARVRVMIGFLVRDRVKVKMRIRVRVGATFDFSAHHWSYCRRSKCRTFSFENRKMLLLHRVYGDSALLVLIGTLLTSDNTVLALSRRFHTWINSKREWIMFCTSGGNVGTAI